MDAIIRIVKPTFCLAQVRNTPSDVLLMLMPSDVIPRGDFDRLRVGILIEIERVELSSAHQYARGARIVREDDTRYVMHICACGQRELWPAGFSKSQRCAACLAITRRHPSPAEREGQPTQEQRSAVLLAALGTRSTEEAA